jgi:hypothetical protein
VCGKKSTTCKFPNTDKNKFREAVEWFEMQWFLVVSYKSWTPVYALQQNPEPFIVQGVWQVNTTIINLCEQWPDKLQYKAVLQVSRT